MDRAEALALYDKVIATQPGIERKGDTVPYTALNGHMFSALHKDGTVALRLPSPVRESFLSKYRASLAAHYGVVQPEYVVVPDKLLAKSVELAPYFAAGLAYVGSMKPKPTAKGKALKRRKGARGG